ncbi:hypothetical protein E5161_04880 [Cohnella pontilimi]|uniref:Uncharacterized protein n=1 Tax=Cohnella pontilimi TaxID=2564100 RepID=A0A4U0FFT2_9BACL|nr:hypothetical protein E5161_04880 [Cohnella pontilimi]
MGEEKPDEELMGKRKSSPRLSPAPLGTGTIMVYLTNGKYTHAGKNFRLSRRALGKPVGHAAFARFRIVVT